MSRKAAEVETVVRELACQLTEAELLERGDAMAACESHIKELKDERRRLNAAIREQSDKRGDLGAIIESKQETRDVPCRWEPDYERREYSLVRSDNGAEVERRAMPEADLQTWLMPEAAPIPIAPRARSTKKKAAAN
jgi:chromosome segregation ATPase